MATEVPRKLMEAAYHDWAQRYLQSLRREGFMEITDQANQSKVTIESLDYIHVQRPDIQTFNELLIQILRARSRRPVQVVSDNMVIVHDEPIVALGSYDVPMQPVGPFWVMEYISKNNWRKDYEVSFPKYEKVFKVPYLSMFTLEDRELVLYKHDGRKYVSVKPNEHGRYPIPELEIEIAVLDGWMRFWFRGELVPLTPDLTRGLQAARQQVVVEQARADAEKGRADRAESRVAQLEQELQRLRSQMGTAES